VAGALSWPAMVPIGEWLLQTSAPSATATALAPPWPPPPWRPLELLEGKPFDGPPAFKARARHWRRALEQAGPGGGSSRGRRILPLPVGPSPWGPGPCNSSRARRPVEAWAIPAAHRGPTGSSRLRLVLRRIFLRSLEAGCAGPGRTQPQRGGP